MIHFAAPNGSSAVTQRQNVNSSARSSAKDHPAPTLARSSAKKKRPSAKKIAPTSKSLGNPVNCQNPAPKKSSTTFWHWRASGGPRLGPGRARAGHRQDPDRAGPGPGQGRAGTGQDRAGARAGPGPGPGSVPDVPNVPNMFRTSGQKLCSARAERAARAARERCSGPTQVRGLRAKAAPRSSIPN